jgi:HEAT repeat protein
VSAGRTLAAFALLAGISAATPTEAAELELREGWTSWEVEAVDDAPAWCCWKDRPHTTVSTCNLDEGRDGYGTRDGERGAGAVKIYARVTAGKLDRLQALAPSCPVETKTPVRDLGAVPADDSARWLVARVEESGKIERERRQFADPVAALAMHRGKLAGDSLARFARSDARVATRKSAVFWLSQARGEEGAAVTSGVMFADREADVRRHAAFSLSQSKSARATPDLVRLGNTDAVADVRAQAWFWLAQTGAPEAESAIGAALRKDSSSHVREHAVFALSQLPDERATKALIATVEDRGLSDEQRKRAIFWLAQSKSSAAQAWLEKVLVRTAAN